MDDWKKAEEHLTRAMSMKSELQHNKIDRAMEAILVRRRRSLSHCVCSQQSCREEGKKMPENTPFSYGFSRAGEKRSRLECCSEMRVGGKSFGSLGRQGQEDQDK